MKNKITMSEWMSVLEETGFSKVPPGYKNSFEIAKEWGCGETTARKRLLCLIDKGLVESGRFSSGVAGRNTLMTYYRIKKVPVKGSK